jgi:hypothetical protein
MTAREWTAAYAAALGLPEPDDALTNGILALAAEAAHASERTAAPVACWLAAASGRDPAEALALAQGIGAS